MPVSVIVGGQYGSEGKGKVAYWIAQDMRAEVAVRVGGANSGHTVITPDGQRRVFRHLPTAALLEWCVCVLPAGSYLDVPVLLEEIRKVGLDSRRLVIDPNAVLIGSAEIAAERAAGLRASIGSTETGTGDAVRRRVARGGNVRFAKDEPSLGPFIRPATSFLRERLREGERVVIEGTQGFGLSVLHTPHYPFATSRDTTAAGFVSEAGLSPLDVDDVIMVIRAFPIRVPGNSGPLPNETTWADVTESSGSTAPLSELTTVTRRVRRIARFDPEIVGLAIANNRPNRIVLNHLDHVDAACRRYAAITQRAHQFLQEVEQGIRQKITFAGVGPAALVCPRAVDVATLRAIP